MFQEAKKSQRVTELELLIPECIVSKKLDVAAKLIRELAGLDRSRGEEYTKIFIAYCKLRGIDPEKYLGNSTLAFQKRDLIEERRSEGGTGRIGQESAKTRTGTCNLEQQACLSGKQAANGEQQELNSVDRQMIEEVRQALNGGYYALNWFDRAKEPVKKAYIVCSEEGKRQVALLVWNVGKEKVSYLFDNRETLDMNDYCILSRYLEFLKLTESNIPKEFLASMPERREIHENLKVFALEFLRSSLRINEDLKENEQGYFSLRENRIRDAVLISNKIKEDFGAVYKEIRVEKENLVYKWTYGHFREDMNETIYLAYVLRRLHDIAELAPVAFRKNEAKLMHEFADHCKKEIKSCITRGWADEFNDNLGDGPYLTMMMNLFDAYPGFLPNWVYSEVKKQAGDSIIETLEAMLLGKDDIGFFADRHDYSRSLYNFFMEYAPERMAEISEMYNRCKEAFGSSDKFYDSYYDSFFSGFKSEWEGGFGQGRGAGHGRETKQDEGSGTHEGDYQSAESPASSYRDKYDILGVSREASDEEIKKAYRTKAMEFHPDKHPNASEDEKRSLGHQFGVLNEAYEEIKKERGIK
ncbi:MAG: J domain-containing protein [Candidatus Micrarchaeota archaeon]|nr:J domain-containing protein [Candidatus Micrarchaeota archaeon]